MHKNQKSGFTLLELLFATIIMVTVIQLVNETYKNFMVSSHRLSSMTYADQEIDRLRSILHRDLRASNTYTIMNNGKTLILQCAIDQADVNDTSGVTAYDSTAYASRSASPDPNVALIDGANGNLYYTVTYEYLTQTATTLGAYGWQSQNNPNVSQNNGILSIKEGVIVRTGPPPDVTHGNVTVSTMQTWNASPQYPVVITSGWLEYTAADGASQTKPVFAYWPDPSNSSTAQGVTINIWKRNTFQSLAKQYNYTQDFSTFVSSRVFR
jgi:Tfp pilus assembly protein PilE